jgi:hypothetical protein
MALGCDKVGNFAFIYVLLDLLDEELYRHFLRSDPMKFNKPRCFRVTSFRIGVVPLYIIGKLDVVISNRVSMAA